MAAQPKKKISRVRGRTRRAHLGVKLMSLTICPNCKHRKPPHIACPECGFYGARKILTTKADKRIARQLLAEKRAAATKGQKAKSPKRPKSLAKPKPKAGKKKPDSKKP